MSKHKKQSESQSNNQGGGFSALPIVVFVVGAGVLIWLIAGSFSSSDNPVSGNDDENLSASGTNVVGEGSEVPVDSTSEVEPESLSDADRQKLLGFWERTDNPPYSIEVRLVRPNGLTDARYYNPRPINVAESLIAGKDGKLAFFMKMDDQGYQGSTYTLVYDEEQDLLVGEYYQATMQQTFEVAFQRAQR